MAPIIKLSTSLGDILIELTPEQTPDTVENFLKYIREGFYNNTIFHRVIKNFMIQGGGFDSSFIQKNNHSPIKNEAKLGLSNLSGTISMARTSDPHSATSQFFINVADNTFLDFKAERADSYGYCAFGRVTEGLDVVMNMSKVATGGRQGHQDVPTEGVILTEASIISE